MRVLKKGNSKTRSLYSMSLLSSILEYGASCWDPYREGQINALDRVQKKAATFVNHTNDSVWEILAQRRKMSGICALLKAYTAVWAWKAIGDRLQGPCYLSRDGHDRKIRARKQRTDIGKYCFVNRTIKLWNQLPAEALATVTCKSHVFRKRVRKVIVSEEK